MERIEYFIAVSALDDRVSNVNFNIFCIAVLLALIFGLMVFNTFRGGK
jgi:hypothetical protein